MTSNDRLVTDPHYKCKRGFVIHIHKRVRGWRASLLLANSTFMLAGQGISALVQAGYFVIIARSLGAGNYGAFVGASAAVGILAPFVGIGTGQILIKNVARDESSFPRCWGNAVALTFGSGLLMTSLAVTAAGALLPPSVGGGLIGLIAMSDLLFARLVTLSGQAYVAIQRLKRTSQFILLPSVLRLLAAALFSISPSSHSPTEWAFLYMVTSGLAAAVALRYVRRELGRGKRQLTEIPGQLKEGFFFSLGLSSETVYNNIDKTMLARLSTLGSTGIYGAAYRIIDATFLPIASVLYAAYARFFKHGAAGIKGGMSFTRRLLIPASIYGALAGAALFLAAPILPIILGRDFRESVDALRWLAPLPLLKAIHYLAADTLTGAGRQVARSFAQISIALFNVGINLWLIPSYSWRGAAWASLASDGLLAVALWSMLLKFRREEVEEAL